MRYALFLIGIITNISFAAVNYVAVGSAQTILTSSDGTNWKYLSLKQQFPNKDFTGIAYGNNLWVAVAPYGTVATSMDGEIWSNHSIPTSEFIPFRSVVFYHNKFFANTDYSIYESINGINWIRTVDNIGFSFTKLMAANDKLFGLGFGNVVLLSGLSWSTVYKGNGTFRSIAYGNNTYVITSQDGSYTLTSYDGVNWTATNSKENEGYRPEGMASIYASGVFVAANHWGATSINGINWSFKTITIDGNLTNRFQFLTIKFDGQKYIATGSDIASSAMLLSYDAINWYSVKFNEKIPGVSLNEVAFRY